MIKFFKINIKYYNKILYNNNVVEEKIIYYKIYCFLSILPRNKTLASSTRHDNELKSSFPD